MAEGQTSSLPKRGWRRSTSQPHSRPSTLEREATPPRSLSLGARIKKLFKIPVLSRLRRPRTYRVDTIRSVTSETSTQEGCPLDCQSFLKSTSPPAQCSDMSRLEDSKHSDVYGGARPKTRSKIPVSIKHSSRNQAKPEPKDIKPKPSKKNKLSKKQQCANLGPADYNYDETISTLRYANRAKNIKNKAKVNEDPKDALLRQFQKEIEDLKKALEDGGIDPNAEGSGSEYETGSEEEVAEDGTVRKRRRKKKGGSKGISKEKMAQIQAQIEADRKKLESQKDMEEDEKKKVEEDLQKKESELKKAQEEQTQLASRLAQIEKKIIVGGENLLEKAEEQERMLEESAKELEARKAKAEELRRALEEKEKEKVDIEEKYSNLQEEVAGKTKKLKKVWTMLMQSKSEIADLQQEHQREMEGLLENVRQLSRELRLQMLVIDNFIPPEYQEMIEQYVHWNEDVGEWQLKCVAYTGNNMRKQTPLPDKDKDKLNEPDLSHVYLAYTAEGAEEAMRPKTGKTSKSGRPKTANRPKSSKKKRREQDIDSVLG